MTIPVFDKDYDVDRAETLDRRTWFPSLLSFQALCYALVQEVFSLQQERKSSDYSTTETW